MNRMDRNRRIRYAGMMGAGGKAVERPSSSGGPASDLLRRAKAERLLEPLEGAGELGAEGVQLEMVESLDQLKETYGIDMSKVQALGAEGDGDQVYVLMPEGEELDAETAAQLMDATANGTLLHEPGPSTSGGTTRVYTVSMGDEKKLLKAATDMPDQILEH